MTCGWLDLSMSFFIEGENDQKIWSPVPAYLIEHSKGLAVFDTGMGARFRIPGPARDAASTVRFDPEDDIAAQMSAMGKDPSAVNWIINSHLHLDHCGGNSSLPNATLVLQRKEIEYARANADGRLYAPADFETGHPMLLLDGEHDLFGDGLVTILPTFGHTPGHQSARVQLPAGNVILAADCCYLKRTLDELRLSALTYDKEQALATLRVLASMRNSGSRIFYGHDADFWATVPQNVPLT
jgi:glyoxylase-like metal-dependent hydrolase (beta-lactamase superfamily II)